MKIAVVISAVVVSLTVIVSTFNPQLADTVAPRGSHAGTAAAEAAAAPSAAAGVNAAWGTVSCDDEAEYNVVGYKAWTDDRGDLVAMVLCRYAHVDLTEVTCTWRREHNANGPDRITINDREIDPTDRPQLWVNGPYGRMVRMALDGVGRSRLQRMFGVVRSLQGDAARPVLEALWDDLVAPQLYSVEARVGGADQGTGVRVIRLADGTRYLRCRYVDGKRDGQWTLWRPDGSVALEAQYVGGKRHGEWIRYDAEGNITAVDPWEDDFPADRAVLCRGPFGTKALEPGGGTSWIPRSE